uniref:Transposase n=1 Tax=Magnetococcus massalia (strain MO-1) TaxID=451514 RepID=A0A1S7LK78_MAGMO
MLGEALGQHAPKKVTDSGKGYKGHGVTETQVFISGQRRGMTPTIKKELRRRSAVEPVIGHQKTEGRLDRNFLGGEFGDVANALLNGIGYNLRTTLRKLRELFALFLMWRYSPNMAMACSQRSC